MSQQVLSAVQMFQGAMISLHGPPDSNAMSYVYFNIVTKRYAKTTHHALKLVPNGIFSHHPMIRLDHVKVFVSRMGDEFPRSVR